MKAMTAPIFKALEKYRRHLTVAGNGSDDTVLFSDPASPLKIIGRSQALRSAVRTAQEYQKNSMSVLILGDTGSGKELIAQSLKKPGQKFYAVNCGKYQSNPQFVESELFGVVKGAFTGADRDRPGIFESAGDGVVFLDEIHRLPLSAQETLLRVLEDRRVRRLGDSSDREIKTNFRLVSAAQTDLSERIRQKTFIQDLLYRVAVLRVNVPSLRERPEDIEPIAEHFLKMVCANEKLGRKIFRSGTFRLMEDYSWPGNIRELRNVISRLAVLSKDEIIEPIDFVRFLMAMDEGAPTDFQSSTLLQHRAYLAIKETEYFQEILRQADNQIAAAKLAGLPRSTFNNKIKKLNIDPNQYLKEVK
jgi:DNA-binding NtrC family response regulator